MTWIECEGWNHPLISNHDWVRLCLDTIFCNSLKKEEAEPRGRYMLRILRYVMVCGTVWLWSVGIFKSARTEKWSEMASDGGTDKTSHLLEKIMTSREWPWIWVGKLTCWFRSKDSKIPVSCLTSDDEDSGWRLKSPINTRSWGSEAR